MVLDRRRSARSAGVARCYTCRVPTKHPRHAITETGEVAEALAALRAAVGPKGFTLAELVVLGAQRRLFEVELDRRRRQRVLDELAERIEQGVPLEIDIDAVDEVRRTGWSRPL